MIFKIESGRVGYRRKYRVSGRVRVPVGHCSNVINVTFAMDQYTEPHFTGCPFYGSASYGTSLYGMPILQKRILRNLNLRDAHSTEAHLTEPHFSECSCFGNASNGRLYVGMQTIVGIPNGWWCNNGNRWGQKAKITVFDCICWTQL